MKTGGQAKRPVWQALCCVLPRPELQPPASVCPPESSRGQSPFTNSCAPTWALTAFCQSEFGLGWSVAAHLSEPSARWTNSHPLPTVKFSCEEKAPGLLGFVCLTRLKRQSVSPQSSPVSCLESCGFKCRLLLPDFLITLSLSCICVRASPVLHNSSTPDTDVLFITSREVSPFLPALTLHFTGRRTFPPAP